MTATTESQSLSTPTQPGDGAASAAFPVMALLALALAGFITILTEALPAGLLPEIGAGLAVSEPLAGQLVTLYAVGSLMAAIPLTTATQGMRRRPLLVIALAGFTVANTVMAISADYGPTLAARLVAGVSAGLLWSIIAGYATRMVPPHKQGRAVAVVMAGIPLALSFGIPAGTFIGHALGWRLCFGLMSLLSLALIAWILLRMPDFPGRAAGRRPTLGAVLATQGVRPVLFVTLAYVLAHNILYTYVAPFLAAAGMADRTDLVLLIFGVSAMIGIWIVGLLIDRVPRVLALTSATLFGLAALALYLDGDELSVVYGAIAIWGLAYGGVPTLFQTALARTSGEGADVAQSMLVTVWNVAIAGGGIGGGLLLDRFGPGAFIPALLCLLAPTVVVIWAARRHGFPHARA